MPGLSRALYTRCRNVLLKCHQFDSNAHLNGVFVVEELAPFYSTISEAGNKPDRVDFCLAALSAKQLKDGQPVLPLFLTVLRDRYSEDDALYIELGALVEAIQ